MSCLLHKIYEAYVLRAVSDRGTILIADFEYAGIRLSFLAVLTTHL